MRLSLFFDHRFRRDREGKVFSATSYNYDLISRRYLSVFDEVNVIARVADSDVVDRSSRALIGPGVSLTPVGNWSGPSQYLRVRKRVRDVIAAELAMDSAILMIAPGRIGQIAFEYLPRNKPYGIEVVGDPYDVFAPGAIRHPLRPFLQYWGTQKLRAQCRNASTIAYVSTAKLPARYPAVNAVFTTDYSSIELRDDHFVASPPSAFDAEGRVRLITIGSLEMPYKGVDVLLDALALTTSHHRNLELTVVGDGHYRAVLQQRAQQLGIADVVRFVGHLPAGDAVRAQLDNADIFVLASRTEGLPRAMIEGMARGLPCIGTDVGGIPELLAPENLVPANDASALAAKILEVASDKNRMLSMSAENLISARKYRADTLQQRRVAHYEALREITAAWQNPKHR